MIKSSLIILFSIISLISYSQPMGITIGEFCTKNDYHELITKLDSLKEASKWPKQRLRKLLEREIINNYYEVYIEFEDHTPKKYYYTYKIKLLKKGNEIIFYKVYKVKRYSNRPNSRMKEKEIIFAKNENSERINDLKKLFRKTYRTNLKFNDLFVTNIRYGNNCGMGSQKAFYRVELETIIDKKKIHKLKKWLRSGTVELQLYAIDGIYIMKEKGFKFKESTLELINEIENKDGRAWICVEDIVGQENITDIVKKIKKEHNI